MPFISKLPELGTTIFTSISALSAKYNAINLGQGFPEYSGNEILHNFVFQAIQEGKNQYAPMAGDIQLRNEIAQKQFLAYNVQYNADTEITITAGATQAIFTALATIIQQNDEVIIFDPSYDCYAPSIRLFGGIPIPIILSAPHFAIDWDQVKQKISTKTKAIIFNNPHNPLARVFDMDDIKMLAQIVEENNLYLIADEVYEHLVFDNIKFHSVCTIETLKNRSFIIYSFGKTLHNTGWKIGYCLAPAYLMLEFRKIHQYIVFSVNTPVQHALARFLTQNNDYIHLPNWYQNKRNIFTKAMQHSKFKLLPSQGTYFILADYSKISNKTDVDFSVELIKEVGVASIPISVFYQNKLDQKILRFCFAKNENTLLKAAEKLCQI
jgi:methionine aminotransferase